MTRSKLFSLAPIALAAGSLAAFAQDAPPVAGAVYTMTNQTSGNEVIIFDRLANGALRRTGSVQTGGRGTGGGLGNQGALALSADQTWLFVVNAGSNDVSTFEVRENGLRLKGTVPSGGIRPVSVTVFQNIVYVLNAGSDNIAGFEILDSGRLIPLPGTVRSLSGTNTAPAQIKFSPDGDLLVVTEKATNRIVLYRLRSPGHPSGPIVHASAGQTPFGFAFGKRHQMFVSEAFGGAPGRAVLSSYQAGDDGDLTPISARVSGGQTAACWVVLGVEEPYAFVSNTESSTISAFHLGFDGGADLAQAVATRTGTGPIDMAVTPGGRYLYVLNAGGLSIGAYRIEAEGHLTSIGGAAGELPPGVNGLAIR